MNGGPRKKGCVILFAAGNYNAPLNDPDNAGFQWRHPTYGLVETTGSILNGNAAHPDVMAVAASTSMNRKAVYSNWGKEIALSTPSNNFHPLDRQARVPGRGIWTTDNELYGRGFTAGSRYTGSFGGTSSATPLAAGVAALIIGEGITDPHAVEQILKDTARAPKSGKLDKKFYGAGIIDAQGGNFTAPLDPNVGTAEFVGDRARVCASNGSAVTIRAPAYSSSISRTARQKR